LLPGSPEPASDPADEPAPGPPEPADDPAEEPALDPAPDPIKIELELEPERETETPGTEMEPESDLERDTDTPPGPTPKPRPTPRPWPSPRSFLAGRLSVVTTAKAKENISSKTETLLHAIGFWTCGMEIANMLESKVAFPLITKIYVQLNYRLPQWNDSRWLLISL
jgi:hypothetical protein